MDCDTCNIKLYVMIGDFSPNSFAPNTGRVINSAMLPNSTRSGSAKRIWQKAMAHDLAQHLITRRGERAARCLMVGLLLILCASFVPVGWSGAMDVLPAASDPADAALRPVAHVWSTDVVVPSLYRPASYAAYSPTRLVHRTALRRLASGEISVRAQILSAQGVAHSAAQYIAQTGLTNLPISFPLLI